MDEAASLSAAGQVFRHFAEVECPQHKSRLYEALSLEVSADPEVLRLVLPGLPGQPKPNLLFAAVHYLLLAGAEHPLKAQYADLAYPSDPDGPAYPVFRNFCLKYDQEITGLISTRLVQSNVVARCICLLPAFASVSEIGGRLPLALIEIGTSAGLNLLWPHYRYEYSNGVVWGDSESGVSLETELRGSGALPAIPPNLGSSWAAGIDLNPVDVGNDDAMLWLRALIWPEHLDQRAQLEAAIGIAGSHPQTIVEGDAVEKIRDLLERAPTDATLCVFATYALYQFSSDALRTLLKSLQAHSQERPVHFLAMEHTGVRQSELMLTRYEAGERTTQHLANCHAHGRWLEWLAD